MSKVIIYSTANCPYCVSAKQLLDQIGVKYSDIRVDMDHEKLNEMVSRSGKRSVPQIFIGDYHVGGYDDLYALNKSGKLEILLQS